MLSKNSSLAVLTLMLIGVSVLLFNVQPTNASGTIYIRADGSIDPATAPIASSDNITYTFSADINDSIRVQRSYITIDGNGYTLQGSGSGAGFALGVDFELHLFVRNVTIRNVNISNFGTGILGGLSDYGTFSQNNITDNGYGISLFGSQHGFGPHKNTISGNNIRDNSVGIALGYSSRDHKIYHNNFIDNAVQVRVEESSTATWDDGYPSGGNYWSDYTGVDLNKDGIGDTPYCTGIGHWDICDRYPLITMGGLPVSCFVHTPVAPTVHETVTFNASASYDLDGYIVGYAWDFGDGATSAETDPITTHVYTTPTLEWTRYDVTLNITDNDGLTDIGKKSINIRKMPTSVSISTSAPSTFVGFRVNITGTLQDRYGNGLEHETVVLYYSFSGITEWIPITSDITDNLGQYNAIWIPPATGYFTLKAEWAGNSTHLGASNTTTLSSIVYNNQYVFLVESNSIISDLAFNTTDWTLSFSATGPNSTGGYVKATIARSLVSNIMDIRVYLDGIQTSEFSATSTDDSWLLTFNYDHSTHQILVDLDIDIIPEYPSLFPLLFIITTLLIVMAKTKKDRTA